MEMSRLTRDGTAEPVPRDQILRRERGQGNIGNIHFSCPADHVQDWQPYLVDLYSCSMCDYTTVLKYIGKGVYCDACRPRSLVGNLHTC